MSLTVAIHQTPGIPGDTTANLRALRDTVERAGRSGADLLVLPEMWLSGYNIGEQAHELAESRDGPAAAEVAEIARAAGMAVVYGYPEREGEDVYNSARLIDASGNASANCRKAHLFGPTERQLFAPGSTELSVLSLGDVRIGMLICYDVEFPEAVRTLCLRGADLVVVPTALMQPYGFVSTHVVPTRAYENQAFVAYANRCGREGDLTYVGGSCICGPGGEELARAAADEEMIVATVDTARRREQAETFWFFDDRRRDLYHQDC